ncbi:glycosyltransferase family 2 protein [Nitratireductor thuwali]|uniref:GalNAc(5)-diNAcBac-PP-undecaprenol beta-1,3-glucosyltransferase n=1 Tax=Nitratireductor thuwali TaxID=2267699 RepID=A0ABY5MLJ7_9HYPH|nr:GalNAc(5)-diNAcBac-PP-undecaprenol beta-1,3-glucosyltransferase [Nitratireductor thuwali]
MSLTPLVSIIIPVKNGMPHFKRVIEMVSIQRFEGKYEVIVIDSGSSDGSKDVVPRNDDRFRLIEIEPSSFGHGRTRNLGAHEARGQFCAFLTHDAAPADTEWLSALVAPLLEDDHVAGVFSRHVAYDGTSPFTAWEIDKHFEHLKNWPKVWISDAREYCRDIGLRQVYHFYSDNSSCLRRSVWKDHPYPDVEFAEDQTWAKIVVEAGYKKAFAWDSVVYHSHEYSIWETVQRSYDEALAFKRLFGYVLCPSKAHIIQSSLRTSLRDIGLASANGWIFSHPIATLRRPFVNFAKNLGYYLAASGKARSQTFAMALSRDRQLYIK